MSMKNARAANWVAERANATATGFNLLGASKDHVTFARAFKGPHEVFYSAMDDRGQRECGYATFDGTNIVDRQPTANLIGNIYSVSSPARVNFTREVTVACTFNASAFNILWSALEAIDPDGDGNINIPPELIDGLGDALRNKADQAALEEEIAARISGDEHLQEQIDELADAASNIGPSDWASITDKPDQIDALGNLNVVDAGTF